MTQSKRQRYEILRSQLELERASFLPHWRDLSEYILPRRGRFSVTDSNRGDKRNQKIIDSTATFAAGTLRSGMMSGITSPARPWFRLTTPDPDLAEFGAVKYWLHLVGQRMSNTFLRSNLYNVLPICYGDIGVFGTHAFCIEEDFDSVIRVYPFPIGSYCLANDEKLKVNTFYREFRMTVRQIVSRFGKKDAKGKPDWSNISDHVKNLWDTHMYETWIEVCHMIQPNPEFDPNRLDSKFKRFSSCYYERGVSGSTSQNYITPGDDKFLSEKGYDYFPVLAPRWEISGEDVYGTSCPGMVALGDIKQLQLGEKRIFQAIDKMVNPPMVAATALRNQKTSILPGDITFADERDGRPAFRPAHEVNPQIQHLEQKQDQVRRRIQRSFYEDLFLMLASSDRRQITAREIDERHEEKLLALGPVLEQLNQDLLDPLIDITFDLEVRQGNIPKPPKELEGVPLKVEYISIMAQAQKLVGISGVERFVGFVGQVAQFNPAVLDKVDGDQMVDIYADMTSVPPSMVRTDEKVAEMRQKQAMAAQAQQQAEMMAQSTQAAKNLSQSDMEGDNALTRIMDVAQAGALTSPMPE